MKTPTAAQKRKLVTLLARYILTDGAHIRVQERAYAAYMAFFEKLEASFPQIAFRSEATQASLVSAARQRAAAKVFRGPGATL